VYSYGDDLRNDFDRGQAIFAGAISKKNADGAILPPLVYAVVDNAGRAMLRALEDTSGHTSVFLKSRVRQDRVVIQCHRHRTKMTMTRKHHSTRKIKKPVWKEQINLKRTKRR
jgi:hypothetical protein